jgi:hypothetical protein
MTGAISKVLTPAMVSVFDADKQYCIGFVLSRGRIGFEAFSAKNESVGVFDTQSKAAAELWRRARGQTTKTGDAP